MGVCTKEILYALVILIGPFTFGTILCYPSPAKDKITAALHPSSTEWSFYNSVSSLFGVFGPVLSSSLLKVFRNSRKKTVLVIAICGTAAWLLNCLTKVHIWAGIVIRALQGIVMGAYSAISPVYLVEIAPPNYSGFYGNLNQIGIMTGMIFLDFVGPSLSYLEMNYVGAAFTALQLILIWFVIESPAVEILNEAGDDSNEKKEPFWQKKNMFGLFIGVAMMFIQQFCGINAILTDLASLMNSSGLALDGNYQAGIASCSQLVAVFVGAAVIDKLGRRIVWLASCSIIVIFLLIFALNTKYNWSTALPLVCIFLYQFGFGLGMGPIPWFIIPEIFEAEFRSTASSWVTVSNWTFSFIIIFVWPAMHDGIGMFNSLIFFMCVTIVGIIFGILCVHNAKADVTGEDVDDGEDSDSKPDSL